MDRSTAEAVAGRAPAELGPLLRELGDLKRVTSAGRPGSLASRLFRRSWAALLAGHAARDVALAATASALAAARLGDLDFPTLVELGVPEPDALGIQRRAVSEIAVGVDPALADDLAAAIGRLPDALGPVPPFVDALDAQPRAGVTCPGKPRIVLLPAESHAEHCLVVAVYGVLLAPPYRADPATVFLAALAHHFHNAAMPDSGFTGEMLLEPHLSEIIARASAAALRQLEPRLAAEVEAARRVLADDRTPEGRAFHAADVIDRVVEIDQHLAAARLTMDVVLTDMELVHHGPVKAFHDRVLAEMGLP